MIKNRSAVARLLTALVAVVTAAGALLADFVVPATAAQHMHNDAWAPHAKFHDAQYIVMSILLGLLALAVLRWRGGARDAVWTACAILTTPWLGLLSALLFPGTAIEDPEFDNPAVLGLHPQVFLSAVLLALLLTAALLVARPRHPA
ncbi:DUF6640 family protein [Nocardia sp. NPDC048505]|uniref:DUF6640 family protein n=1 Tax=Nocardia sp. NPDC048505 TaxID=3155756 RepID=UPI00340E01FB